VLQAWSATNKPSLISKPVVIEKKTRQVSRQVSRPVPRQVKKQETPSVVDLTVSSRKGGRTGWAKERDALSGALLEVSASMQLMRAEMLRQQALLLGLMGRVESITAKLDALEAE
jgi:hypothetical protein